MELLHRLDFPGITTLRGAYFDTAATAHKPSCVIAAMHDVYTREYATVHRGFYDHAERMTIRYEQARADVARWINARVSQEIVFTQGATAGINMIARSWACYAMRPGDEIVVTALEHHAHLLPWEAIAREFGLRMRYIPVYDDTVEFDMSRVSEYFSEKTRLLALCTSSNLVGSLPRQTIVTLCAAAKAVGAAVCIDAAQTVAHERIDVQWLDPDFMVFSGHKMYGPSGIGIAYVAQRRHEEMRPYTYGGGMVVRADAQHPEWKEMPHLLEAGTPPICAVIGLQAAITYLASYVDYEALRVHEASLTAQLIDGLREVGEIRILGNQAHMRQYGSMVSFAVPGIHAHDIAHYVALRGMCVRSGDHCCQRLHQSLGLDATVRASFGIYTTAYEVASLIVAIKESVSFLR